MKKIDLMGQRFGKLVVIGEAPNTKYGQARWLCQCDCGGTTISTGNDLRNGHTTSCGCTRNEKIKNLNLRHGESNTRLYREWMDIRDRCSRPSDPDYDIYGGRGIKVCDEWDKSYEAFRDWARANGYNDSLTIDRIDPNGDYEPSNCRWADEYVQAQNRRNAHLVEYHGETGCLDAMCRKLNVNSKTIRARMSNLGYTFEEAVDLFPHTSEFREYWKKPEANLPSDTSAA